MDWFLYDNGIRHERAKKKKNTALAEYKDIVNFCLVSHIIFVNIRLSRRLLRTLLVS